MSRKDQVSPISLLLVVLNVLLSLNHSPLHDLAQESLAADNVAGKGAASQSLSVAALSGGTSSRGSAVASGTGTGTGSGSGTSTGSGAGTNLDRNDTTEGTSASAVLTADKADVLLTSDGTSACLAGRDGGDKRVVSLGTIPVAGVAAGNLGGNLDGGPLGSSAIRVDLAGVGA